MTTDAYNALPARVLSSSPVEHTLNLLQERVFRAEGETNKLAKQLVNYGFKRVPEEKPHRGGGSKSSTIPQSYDKVVTRLCKMESLITSLTAGMESLEAEKSTSMSQLMQEKKQIVENYGEQLKRARDEVDKQKQSLVAHSEAKSQLEKQIGKLKKDTVKRVEMQKLLADKLKEKEMALHAFQSKFSEVSKELSNGQSSRKRMEDSHALLALKVTEMETAVESERAKVDSLNQKCMSLTEDALLARAEFEKEFSCRLQFQDVMAVHEEEIKSATENLGKCEEENDKLFKKLVATENSLSSISAENEKFKGLLDTTHVDNEHLKQALKKAAIDNQALVNQTKEAIAREQWKVDQAIQQQGKILDSAKESLLAELNKQQKHSQNCESENQKLADKVNELSSRNSEFDFKLKMAEQTMSNESVRLQNMVASAEKVKDELARQLKQKENELVNMSNNWMKEKTAMMEKCRDISHHLHRAEQQSELMEREKNEVSEKLSWINTKNLSQENMENKFLDMVAEKNRLAYEKGTMQSKVSSLEAQLEDLALVNSEKREMKLERNKIDSDLQYKDAELQRMAYELESLDSTENKLSKVTQDYNGAIVHVETLMKQIEAARKKHDNEVASYESRLVYLEKERKNIATTVESIISTNNMLQMELENSQEEMGRKDAHIEDLTNQVQESQHVVNELRSELRRLTNQVNMLGGEENTEIENLKENLKIEISEKCLVQSKWEKQKSEIKDLKCLLKKLTEDYKCKDKELKGYIAAKHADSAKMQKQHETLICSIKEDQKKEVSNLKRQIQELVSSRKKEKAHYEENNSTLETFSRHFKALEEDKKAYVEKNIKQAMLLDEFMSQITDLQNELSNVIKSQSEADVKLREKDKLINMERRKRHDIQQKYQFLLKGNTRKDVEKDGRSVSESINKAASNDYHEQSSTTTTACDGELSDVSQRGKR